MSNDTDTKKGHHQELKWAGLEIGARQFEQFCQAVEHTELLVRRIPRNRSRWDEPANVFELPETASNKGEDRER